MDDGQASTHVIELRSVGRRQPPRAEAPNWPRSTSFEDGALQFFPGEIGQFDLLRFHQLARGVGILEHLPPCRAPRSLAVLVA